MSKDQPSASKYQPWTRAQVIEARPDVIARARALNDLLVTPPGVLPQAEGDPVRVFAVGIHDTFAVCRRPEVDEATVAKTLGAYVRTFAYRLAMAQPNSMRHDVDGNPVEAVRDTERLRAQEDCLKLMARARLRRAREEIPVQST